MIETDHIFETAMTLPLPRERVFEFFAEARNLERITPAFLSFQIVEAPGVLGERSRLAYRLRIRGIPVSWHTRIDRWNPPYEFVDRQVRGPYRKWVHTHSFLEIPGGTEIRDRVEYLLPFWPLGEVLRVPIRRDIERIFDFRRQEVRRILLPSETGSTGNP